jgi:uncharacterized protein
MFASTNLVLELGIILWLLLGWQFALAEFVGGAIMIALFVLLAPRIFPKDEIAAARERLQKKRTGDGEHQQVVDTSLPLRQRLRSRDGWVAAASYTIADLTMLRRELVLGYLIAGVLVVAVPSSIYSVLFFQGHGFFTDIENVIVGPLIAFVSFVCSVGNVPLAAALFHGGFSFGGTVAFIFADLITLPLVLIYAKLYGRRLAIRLALSFWLVMSTAGLAVDLLFRLVQIPAPTVPDEVAPMHLEWNYTTFLNIAFLVLGVIVYIVHRNRGRLVTESAYAIDPVCGMQVEIANAPTDSVENNGETYYFCNDHCHDRFAAKPERFLD